MNGDLVVDSMITPKLTPDLTQRNRSSPNTEPASPFHELASVSGPSYSATTLSALRAMNQPSRTTLPLPESPLPGRVSAQSFRDAFGRSLANLAEKMGVSIYHGAGNPAYISEGKRIELGGTIDTAVLTHEFVHGWLYNTVGFDHKSTFSKATAFTPSTQRYIDLSNKLSHLLKDEQLYNSSVRKELEKVLGKGEYYETAHLPRSSSSKTYQGISLLGSLVDESQLPHLFKKDAGHPMSNFHEFVASTVTYLTHDTEGKVSSQYLKLLRIGDNNPSSFRPTLKAFSSLLKEALELGEGLFFELSKEAKESSQGRTLSKNLTSLKSLIR
jgi:hypothetical protein